MNWYSTTLMRQDKKCSFQKERKKQLLTKLLLTSLSEQYMLTQNIIVVVRTALVGAGSCTRTIPTFDPGSWQHCIALTAFLFCTGYKMYQVFFFLFEWKLTGVCSTVEVPTVEKLTVHQCISAKHPIGVLQVVAMVGALALQCFLSCVENVDQTLNKCVMFFTCTSHHCVACARCSAFIFPAVLRDSSYTYIQVLKIFASAHTTNDNRVMAAASSFCCGQLLARPCVHTVAEVVHRMPVGNLVAGMWAWGGSVVTIPCSPPPGAKR